MPKLIDRDAYRSDLRKRAVKSFSSNGFDGLSMKQLAASLGISHALFYHYFDSKEALFLQMTEELAQELLGELTEGIDDSQPLAQKVEWISIRAEARDADLQCLQRLMSDYMRLVGDTSDSARASLEEIVSAIRASFQATLGVNNTQMDLVFTISLGILLGRSIHSSGTDHAALRQQLIKLVSSDFFNSLDTST